MLPKNQINKLKIEQNALQLWCGAASGMAGHQKAHRHLSAGRAEKGEQTSGRLATATPWEGQQLLSALATAGGRSLGPISACALGMGEMYLPVASCFQNTDCG